MRLSPCRGGDQTLAAWTKCGRSSPRCAYHELLGARCHKILYFHFFFCVQGPTPGPGRGQIPRSFFRGEVISSSDLASTRQVKLLLGPLRPSPKPPPKF